MLLEAIDTYRPPFSPWLIGVLVAGAAFGAIALYVRAARQGGGRRAATLATLRLAALAAVAWILAGPSVMHTRPEHIGPGGDRLPIVQMLIDTSASMTERDVRAGDGDTVTRWDAIAQSWLEPAFLHELSRQSQLQLHGFDEEVHPLAIDQAHAHTPDGQATHLFAAIDRVIAAAPDGGPDAVVLLSDGRDTRRVMDERLADRLDERGIRVFSVPVGASRSGPHLALHAWPEADVLHEGQSTTIHAHIAQHGHAGRSVRVALYRHDERIDEQHVSFDEATASHRLRFEVTPPGPGPRSVVMHSYELRIEPTDDGAETMREALTADRHRDRVFIQVSRERIRVALLEGEPYWDTRFLARVLQRDPRIELTAVYALGDERRLHVTDPDAETVGPGTLLDSEGIDPDALHHYDVVVLGRRLDRFFSGDRAQLLRAYVQERGGALVLARGRPFDVATERGRRAMAAIEPIAPVTWGEGEAGRLRLALTDHGRRSPLLGPEVLDDDDAPVLTRWPAMLAATRVEGVRAASVVLLRQALDEGEVAEAGMAALVHGRAGRGRVLAVLGEGLWRWALLPDDERAQRGVYELFWSRAMRWLAADGEFLPGQDVALTLDRMALEPGELARVTVATRHAAPDFEPMLTRIGPDGHRQHITMERDAASATRWSGTVRPTEAGVHRLELRDAGTSALIEPAAPITGHLAVERASIETLDTAARPDVLAALATATGGAVLAVDQRERLTAHLAAIREARRYEPEPAHDFARWPAFVIIALCLGLEWMVRRRGGWL